jgi:hypothetical protein
MAGQCPPILPGLPPLPKINVGNECPVTEPLNKNNEKHSLEDQRVYSDWVSRTRDYYNSLSYDQRRAIHSYTGEKYRKINHCVECIYDKNYDAISNSPILYFGKTEKLVSILHDVIEGAPRPSKILYAYRGTNTKWISADEGKFVSKLFASFSMDPETAHSFDEGRFVRVELGPHVPHLLNIASFFDAEAEILFSPGTIFEIVGKSTFQIKTNQKYFAIRDKLVDIIHLKARKGKKFQKSGESGLFVDRSRSRSRSKSPLRASVLASPAATPAKPLSPKLSQMEKNFRKWFDKMAREGIIQRHLEGQYNSGTYKEMFTRNNTLMSFYESDFRL